MLFPFRETIINVAAGDEHPDIEAIKARIRAAMPQRRTCPCCGGPDMDDRDFERAWIKIWPRMDYLLFELRCHRDHFGSGSSLALSNPTPPASNPTAATI